MRTEKKVEPKERKRMTVCESEILKILLAVRYPKSSAA